MSLGYYDPDSRYRRRMRGFIVRTTLFVLAVAAASTIGYRLGLEQLRSRETRLTDEVRALQEEKTALEQQAIRMDAAARTAQAQYRDLLARFEREVPAGELRHLSSLVAKRLEEGVPAERLAFYIKTAARVRNCGAPETKRFIVPTPTYQGANTAVTFADGRITVTGMGTNARSETGSAEAWYDPALPVKVIFTTIGGEQSESTGPLPLHHSVVVGGNEYRFTIVEGDRSFVQVTSDRCAFP